MSNHCHNSYDTRLIHQEPSWVGEKLAVTLVTWTRGIYTPLKLAIPPLTAQRSFACSVASLSQSPLHYLPGHHSLRCVVPAECSLGQDKPSTCCAERNAVPRVVLAGIVIALLNHDRVPDAPCPQHRLMARTAALTMLSWARPASV